MTQHGETVDCIDINKQPAFDHPLLKDHKIQMKPNLPSDFRMEEASTSEGRAHVNFNRIRCPPGTVPILRATKASLARAKDYSHFHPATPESPGLHQAVLEAKPGVLMGGKASGTVYNYEVKSGQKTSSKMWLTSGDRLNSISVGWTIAPDLFNDTLSHYFIEWDDWNPSGFKAGCINLLCQGFVQVDQSAFPGMAFHDVSQDQVTGNWWLYMLSGNISVGYWPAAILPKLRNGASFFSVGGISQAPVGGLNPPIGSGQFPDDDYLHSAFFRELQFVESAGNWEDVQQNTTSVDVDNPACFTLQNTGWDGEINRYVIMYGGPGGSCGA
ncbi:Neprosin activation peptide [Dillenia turbinata]|uniref:Neprosin activation peptide n=1 Tax=Dillenia turbinata TaxID=194707 RepID=A0AAN8YYP8_9MAGN